MTLEEGWNGGGVFGGREFAKLALIWRRSAFVTSEGSSLRPLYDSVRNAVTTAENKPAFGWKGTDVISQNTESMGIKL